MTSRERSARRRRRILTTVAVLLLIIVLVAVAGIVLGSRGSGREPTVPPRTKPTPEVVRPALPRRLTLREQQDRAVARLAAVGRPIFCGAPRGRELALTFDDGPGPYTAQLLRILRRRGAQATFFLVGNRLRFWRDLAAEDARLGAVGDHTWDHADLSRIPRGRALSEIDRARQEIEQVLGAPVAMLRPPYGRLPPALRGELRARHLLEVRWSADGGDYLHGTTAKQLVRRLLPSLRPGAIVILHDTHAVTVRALPMLLDAIEKQGLRAVTVPELMRYDPPSRAQLRADERGKACVR